MAEKIYQYNENLCFEVEPSLNWGKRPVRFICPEHRMPMVVEYNKNTFEPETEVKCPLCERLGETLSGRYFECTDEGLCERALAMYDAANYKDAKLIRIDDVYTPEISKKIEPKETDYFITADVKRDKDNDTIVVLYIGHKGDKKKAELFIKPEKLGLTHDYHDLDPAKVLARIELTLKDRTIVQDFSDK